MLLESEEWECVRELENKRWGWDIPNFKKKSNNNNFGPTVAFDKCRYTSLIRAQPIVAFSNAAIGSSNTYTYIYIYIYYIVFWLVLFFFLGPIVVFENTAIGPLF